MTLIGQNYLNDGGSITLTSGIVSEEPIHDSQRGDRRLCSRRCEEILGKARINVVSPTYVDQSAEIFSPFVPGYESVPVRELH